MNNQPDLSETAQVILTEIAGGRSYDQILRRHPHLSFNEIVRDPADTGRTPWIVSAA